MNTASHMKEWFHHIHMPSHDSLLQIEKALMSRKIWLTVGTILLVGLVMALAFWASHNSGPMDHWPTRGPYQDFPLVPW